MTCKGTVKNGVVVLREPHALPDGAEVEVQTLPPEQDDAELRRLSDDLLKLAGTLPDLPPDMARNHDHYIHGTPKR